MSVVAELIEHFRFSALINSPDGLPMLQTSKAHSYLPDQFRLMYSSDFFSVKDSLCECRNLDGAIEE